RLGPAAGESPPSDRRGRLHSGRCRRATPPARIDADTAVRRSRSDRLRASRGAPSGRTRRRAPSVRPAYRRGDRRAGGGADLGNQLGATDRLCETLVSWRLLAGGVAPWLSHRAYSTTSAEPPLSNFNSYWDIPSHPTIVISRPPSLDPSCVMKYWANSFR